MLTKSWTCEICHGYAFMTVSPMTRLSTGPPRKGPWERTSTKRRSLDPRTGLVWNVFKLQCSNHICLNYPPVYISAWLIFSVSRLSYASRSGAATTSLCDSQSSSSEIKDLKASSFVRGCDVFRFLFNQINELLSFKVIAAMCWLRPAQAQATIP